MFQSRSSHIPGGLTTGAQRATHISTLTKKMAMAFQGHVNHLPTLPFAWIALCPVLPPPTSQSSKRHTHIYKTSQISHDRLHTVSQWGSLKNLAQHNIVRTQRGSHIEWNVAEEWVDRYRHCRPMIWTCVHDIYGIHDRGLEENDLVVNISLNVGNQPYTRCSKASKVGIKAHISLCPVTIGTTHNPEDNANLIA